MKRLSIFIAIILSAMFFAVPSLRTSALSDDYSIAVLDETSAELSIPDNIGIEIPETNESIPIIGIIMWALAAFANISGANSMDKSVRRERYKKKPMKKSKYSKYKE